MKFTEKQMKEIEEVVSFTEDGKMNVKGVTGDVEGNVVPIAEGVTNRGGINTNPSAALSRPAPPQPYGGAAFPHVSPHLSRTGMTLRDYFAGQWICGNFDCSGFRDGSAYNLAAKMAYRFADAMIAERAKQGESK